MRSPERYAAYLREFAADPDLIRLKRSAQQAGAYPEGPDNSWRYDFTRLPVHDALLKAYKLDEIAGQGTVFERSLRIMDWLCAHTYYSGMNLLSGLLFSRSLFKGTWANSLRVLRFAYDRPFRRSLNCGHKAVILADCLMAAGIAAMPLTFMNYIYRPEEEKAEHMPNHTAVHVWLPKERRWVMLDPSMNSYVADNVGRALDLVEIQRRHRQGEELRVAQYHLNGTQDFREEYLDSFVLGCLLDIVVCDGSSRIGGFHRNRLLPEDVPPKDDKARAITTAELLAEPKLI